MSTGMSHQDAAAALERAGRAAESVRRDGRWAARYLVLFAAGFTVVMLVFGLVPDVRVAMPIFLGLWIPLVVGAVVWANRQRSAPHRVGRWFAVGFAGTGVLYAAGLVVGLTRFHGDLAYWVPAAVVVAVPLLVAAWKVGRR